MENLTTQTGQSNSAPDLAAKYRTAHQHRLMLLTKIPDDVPSKSEFCNIVAVETVEPGLWITVRFLDGSRKGMRPENIRLVTEEEEQFSKGLIEPVKV